ncbi:MAG TPA: hypothetical protein VIH30_05935 [Aquirhabdus sp.]
MTNYVLNWSILEACELVLALPENMPTPEPLLRRIYKGNGYRLMNSPVPRQWRVTIKTTAKHDDGTEHTHTMYFNPDSKVMLRTLIDLIKDRWIDTADADLAGLTAVSAIATARCVVK